MIHMEFMTHLVFRVLNRLHLGFSYLREDKHRHNFTDTLNPLCSCSLETENTEHYFLHYQKNLSFGTTLMNDLRNINTAILQLQLQDTNCIYQIYKRYTTFHSLTICICPVCTHTYFYWHKHFLYDFLKVFFL